MFEHQILERIEHRLSTIDDKLDRLMATAQNILDAAQNLDQGMQNLSTSVTNLVSRVASQPAGVLTPDQADTVNNILVSIGTAAQTAVSQIDALVPAQPVS